MPGNLEYASFPTIRYDGMPHTSTWKHFRDMVPSDTRVAGVARDGEHLVPEVNTIELYIAMGR